MLNTIAYLFGYGTEDVTNQIDDGISDLFATKDTEDDWTLVDLTQPRIHDESPSEMCDESSSCERENLLIEHPSMFVAPTTQRGDSEPQLLPDKKTSSPAKRSSVNAVPNLRRSQRRVARQAQQLMAQQSKHNQLKRKRVEAAHRNKAMQKMRQVVQQPRKRY